MANIFKRWVVLVMGLVLLVACSDSPGSTPTPDAAPTDLAPAAIQAPAPTAAPAATNTPEPAPSTATSPNTPSTNCENRAGNVRDATVPDDTMFKPGWRL